MNGKQKKQDGERRWPSPALFMLGVMAVAVAAASYAERAKALPAVAALAETPAQGPAAAEAPAAEAREVAAKEEEEDKVCIEVNIPATEMIVFENGVPLFKRRVAIGQGVYPTPALDSSIKRIEWNPWWYPPPNAPWAKGAKPTPPGPGNPLGLVKMPLSSEILFHGTNKESSVGFAASHGCMRMINREVAAIAWYFQSNFSDKTDPALREMYRKNSGTTYTVPLKTPVPVSLVYRPVAARGDSLFFYPDHYNRIAGRRKAAIVGELLRSGVDISLINDEKIDELAARWPERAAEVPILSLILNPPVSDKYEGPMCE